MQGICTLWSPPSTTGNAPGPQDVANTGLDVVMARDGIRMDDIGIADINDGYAIGGQVNDIVFMVVGAAMTEGKEGRGLADRAGAKTRGGAVLGAHVEGRAQHRHIGLDIFPVQAHRLLGEGAVTDERQVEPALLVYMFGHDCFSP